MQAQIDEIKNNKNPSIQKKINKSEEKIKDIKENPEQITHDRLSKIGFIIGAIIIFFLTCYLFVFYSSATYSALFKEFTRNDIGVASSIFDPQAIQKAYHAGIWELALIILAPFIFLALGFLIHKFVEHKELHFWPQFWSYVKVALLLIVTLSFDCIIAFKISKEIFKLEETLKSPLFDMGIALHDINFWTIIFAGFVVYVVWGLVFSFTMDEYEKLDAVQMAIKNEQKKINQWNEEVDSLNNEIDLKARQIQDNKKKIGELQEILSRGIIVYRDYERIHFEFMTGWMKCIEANAFGEDKKGLAEKASIDKLNEIKNKFEPINA